MAGGEDEAVAAGPVRVGRVVAHLLRVEEVGDGGERHRGARMARVRLLHRVHREGADRVDRLGAGIRRALHCEHIASRTPDRVYPTCRGRPDRIQAAQGVLRRPALRRGLVLGRPRRSGSRSRARTAPARRRCCARSWARRRSRAASSRSQKGTRVALHDQRPPRDHGLTLREYALSGAADLVAIEEELRRARAGDGGRRPRRRDDAPLQRGAGAARARGRLGLARPRGLGAPRPRLPRRTTSTGSSPRSRAAS